MRKLLLLTLCLWLGSAWGATAATILDYSTLPVNDAFGGFGTNGGLQFLNSVDFELEGVRILLGGSESNPIDFQVVEFEGSLGDKTGVVIGTVAGISVGGTPYLSFIEDSTFIDLTGFGITLEQDVVYGFVFNGAAVGGGSFGAVDTYPNIGTIFNGDGNGTFKSLPGFEIPFQAFGTVVPEPSTALLLSFGLIAISTTRRPSRVRSA